MEQEEEWVILLNTRKVPQLLVAALFQAFGLQNLNLSSGATTKWLLSLEFLIPSEDRRLGMVDRGPVEPWAEGWDRGREGLDGGLEGGRVGVAARGGRELVGPDW